jgi:hypothetical protein
MARPLKAVDADRVQVTVSLRLPAGLRARLEAEAAKWDRNLSGEAERRLRRSFDAAELASDAFDMVRGEDGLWPHDAKPLLQLILWKMYGREVGDAILVFGDNLAWAYQGARAVRGREDLEIVLKPALKKIEATHDENDRAVAKMPVRPVTSGSRSGSR